MDEADIVVELLMHIDSIGRVRNHGTACRTRKDPYPQSLQCLLGFETKIRPVLMRISTHNSGQTGMCSDKNGRVSP